MVQNSLHSYNEVEKTWKLDILGLVIPPFLEITDTDLIHVIELGMNNSRPFATVQLNINANRASGVFLV
jgi:hypothetical protein